VNRYEGFRRIAIAVWIVGAAYITLHAAVFTVHNVQGAPEVNADLLALPFENVCTASDAMYHNECLRPDAMSRLEELVRAYRERSERNGRPFSSGDPLIDAEELLRQAEASKRDSDLMEQRVLEIRREGVDPNRVVQKGMEALLIGPLIGLLAGLVWTGVARGTFRLVTWVVRGFARGGDKA
jgi:hypothetical protein